MSFLLEADIVSQGLVFRNAPPLWVLFLVILPAVVGFSVFFYRLGRQGSPGIRAVLTALRTLVLLFLIALLMDPALETQQVERRKALTVIMVDVSASMSHRDAYGSDLNIAESLRTAAQVPVGAPLDSLTRLDLVEQVLRGPQGDFLSRLASENEVRIYAFGEQLRSIAAVEGLEAHDRVTAIGRALERVLDEPEVKSRAVAGVVLITDGKNTDGPLPSTAAEIARERKVPIYTVGVGDPEALRDVELVSINAPTVMLADDTMVIDLKVRNSGFKTQRVELRLLENGRPFHREFATLLDTKEDQSFQLSYRATREGRFQWEVEVRPLAGEHTTDNNRKTHDVSVRRERLKVLYVDTFPRWEYRKLMSFLTRAEEAFEAQCLLLCAEPGFPQESSPGVPPLDSFPDDEEALFAYDVIMFGDVDLTELSRDPRRANRALEMVRKFVEGGGGFAMIAGDRFSPQAFKDTPVGDLLPVIIDPSETSSLGDEGGTSFRVRVTEVGRSDPLMQLVSDPEQNVRIWEGTDSEFRLDDSYLFARVKKAKPGARVLATHASERNIHGAYPIIVAGTYGDGPVFFTAIDDTWAWYRHHGAFFFHRFWGNVVRHLARTKLFAGDKRFRLVSNRSEYRVGDRITLSAYVKDRSFRPATEEQQEVVLRRPDQAGQEERLRLKLVEPGVYEKSFVAIDVGDYAAWILPEEGLSDDKISPISFRVEVSDVERREPILDEAALKLVASRSEGRYTRLPGARDLLQEVSGEMVEIPRQRRFLHLRDQAGGWLWALPIFFVLLLAAEWMLRKRYRLL